MLNSKKKRFDFSPRTSFLLLSVICSKEGKKVNPSDYQRKWVFATNSNFEILRVYIIKLRYFTRQLRMGPGLIWSSSLIYIFVGFNRLLKKWSKQRSKNLFRGSVLHSTDIRIRNLEQLWQKLSSFTDYSSLKELIIQKFLSQIF